MRTDKKRIADALRHRTGTLDRRRGAVGGTGNTELFDERTEPFTILSEIDPVHRRPENSVSGGGKCMGELEGRLAAETHDDPVGSLLLADIQNVFQRERLEVELVRRVVVGGDRFGVAVHHDGLVPLFCQTHHAVNATIIELDSLADPVRTSSRITTFFRPLLRASFSVSYVE